ncbi:MAG TPA: PIN domain-containing protein [Longimicrobiales bacterium]|nr:PIN domain-containing protein [Longimicrobiales bacterium]
MTGSLPLERTNTCATPGPRKSRAGVRVAFLFDTDAISELLRPQPLRAYVEWLGVVPREEQVASAVTIGERFKGAYRSQASERHVRNIEERVLPALTVRPYDVATARGFGRIRAALERKGRIFPDVDLQIAATAIHHGLALVPGDVRHFERIADLRLNRILAEARRDR